jgi:hypothetical protein
MFPSLRLVVSFLVLCLTFSPVAFASKSTDFTDSGGTISGPNGGLSLVSVTGELGTVSFSTGALMGGSLQMGGRFAGGDSFAIVGNGTIADGVLFSGAFSGPATWTLTTLANGTHSYTLTAVVTRTMGSTPVQGVTVQLTINTGKGFFNGSTLIAGGDTTVVSFVPEPSTLTMLSTGVLAFAGGIGRRLIG